MTLDIGTIRTGLKATLDTIDFGDLTLSVYDIPQGGTASPCVMFGPFTIDYGQPKAEIKWTIGAAVTTGSGFEGIRQLDDLVSAVIAKVESDRGLTGSVDSAAVIEVGQYETERNDKGVEFFTCPIVVEIIA